MARNNAQADEKLGWPLKPIEKCEYIWSFFKAIRENVNYPRGPPRKLDK